MSVRLLDRNQSRVEFLSNFHNMRRDIELLLMRDFGLKKRKYETALMEEIYQIDCNKSVQSMDRYFIQHIGGLYE